MRGGTISKSYDKGLVSRRVCVLGKEKRRVFPDRKKYSDLVWYSSRLAHQTIDFSLSFSSRRVRIAGSVDDVTVNNNITVDRHCYRRTHGVARLVAASTDLAFYFS